MCPAKLIKVCKLVKIIMSNGLMVHNSILNQKVVDSNCSPPPHIHQTQDLFQSLVNKHYTYKQHVVLGMKYLNVREKSHAMLCVTGNQKWC